MFAPATVSNLGPGFDVFGLALEGPGDVVIVEEAEGEGVVSIDVSGDDGRVPRDPRNSAAVAATAVLGALGPGRGVRIEVRKGLPLSAGLGGSAASAVAGAVATQALFGGTLSTAELLRAAVLGEAGGSGASHADNAAPALVGGFVIVPPGDPLDVVQVPTPSDLRVAVAHPHVEVETRSARRLVDRPVAFELAVAQSGNAAGFVAALYREDWDLLERCARDLLAEPLRRGLVPGFDEVVSAARSAGAAACGLSGSGPSMFALCRGDGVAEVVGQSMVEAFRDGGSVDADLIVSAVSPSGARLVDSPVGT